MEMLAQFVLAAGLAWASGIRFYAVLFAFGMLARFDYVALPDALALIEHDYVLWASGVMLVGEFIADKVPWFDSAWDALHTFIRIPGGIMLAWGALGDHGPAAQFAAALIGGSIVTGTHLTKSAARATLNQSPEPFSNWAASFAEDGIVLGGIWLLVTYPIVFALLLVLFVLLIAWLLPKLWRGLRTLWHRLARPGGDIVSGDPSAPR
ncbi:MAG TPA: DUF4126 domain-containing protein [Candidatus Saccharimonadia bacterium]|nr:DUF4126 domain-containing protein [Candidatus Saccharimonadia bacterium]